MHIGSSRIHIRRVQAQVECHQPGVEGAGRPWTVPRPVAEFRRCCHEAPAFRHTRPVRSLAGTLSQSCEKRPEPCRTAVGAPSRNSSSLRKPHSRGRRPAGFVRQLGVIGHHGDRLLGYQGDFAALSGHLLVLNGGKA